VKIKLILDTSNAQLDAMRWKVHVIRVQMTNAAKGFEATLLFLSYPILWSRISRFR